MKRQSQKLTVALSHRVIIIMIPLIGPLPLNIIIFLCDISDSAVLDFEVSAETLCMGPFTKLWPGMKEGECRLVLSSFIFPTATSVPGRTGRSPRQVGEGVLPRCK